VNNSPLRKYFGQNYGRKEDSLEARAMAANPMIDYKGQPIFKDQYDALAAVAEQYAKKPEELTIVGIEAGLVKKLSLRDMCIQTSDGTLTVPNEFSSLRELYCCEHKLQSLVLPKELTSLQVLYCYDNQLQSLVLPKELTSLHRLYCSYNQLQSLVLPKELISLQRLDCDRNFLQSLVLPKELTSLRFLSCGVNHIQSLVLPKELNALKILYCDGNPSLPRETLSELRSRGVEVHE